MEKIETIILDLGGVLLNISFEATEKAFESIGLTNFHQYFSQYKASPLFEQLETGVVSEQEFFTYFRKETGLDVDDETITTAWNAMLLDFPPERIEWLRSLENRYRVFLFSNTNSIHHEAFQLKFSAEFPGKPFDLHFEKAYYSHLLGKRKPYVDAFEALIRDANINPATAIFIDDTKTNIEGAQQVGMKGIFLTNGETVLDLGI
ncbi:HAD family phosphatase [Flavihumibacter cheonanensis]|jgi:HAD superfamily hydrolase (TIGR01509 family)|uniref:HAD family hydrolase n=1 Tax=Flavihumibacter cheonanensis TaxID=1442385 RepID=UPI001EF7E7DC|nr:HAD family phosphatase [Flavihumibacter cheonanensis]MCG7754767.1 HAD family phosphatase [Flavihumibacter cheonanensis]